MATSRPEDNEAIKAAVIRWDQIDVSKLSIGDMKSTPESKFKAASVTYDGDTNDLLIQLTPMNMYVQKGNFDEVKYKLHVGFRDQSRILTDSQISTSRTFRSIASQIDNMVLEHAAENEWFKHPEKKGKYTAVDLRDKFHSQIKEGKGGYCDELHAKLYIGNDDDPRFYSDPYKTPLICCDKRRNVLNLNKHTYKEVLPRSAIGRAILRLSGVTIHSGKLTINWTVQQIQVLRGKNYAEVRRLSAFVMTSNEDDEVPSESDNDLDTGAEVPGEFDEVHDVKDRKEPEPKEVKRVKRSK